jgi:hypothetical protein
MKSTYRLGYRSRRALLTHRAPTLDGDEEPLFGGHSYTKPAILVIPIESVDKGYLAWLMAETEVSSEEFGLPIDSGT